MRGSFCDRVGMLAACVGLLGAACSTPASAPCAHDVDCGQGQVCKGGVCQAAGVCTPACPAGKTCYLNHCVAVSCASEVCRDGEVCVDSHCQVLGQCPTCPSGERCAHDGACHPIACGSLSCSAREVCDGNACLDQLCVGVVCTVGQECVAGKCRSASGCPGGSCASGSYCVEGSCLEGDCVGAVCLPGTQCQAHRCVPVGADAGCGACVNCSDSCGSACDESLACGANGTCRGGTCVEPETDGGCGACVACKDGCGAACNEGGSCGTNLVCSAGSCVSSCTASCAAPDQCHQAGTCNGDGTCSFANKPDNTACDDGNSCTQNDVCTGGVCAGTIFGCATFHAIPLVRVVDTRTPKGATPLVSKSPQTLTLGGANGIPAGATAVTGTVAVISGSRTGYVLLAPTPTACGQFGSINNFPVNDVRANGFTIGLTNNQVDVVFCDASTTDTVDFIIDISGYYATDPAGSTFHPITPARFVDTRNGTGLPSALSSHVLQTFQLSGRLGVPSNAVAVTGNATAVSASGGNITVGPSVADPPATSTINFPAGDARAVAVTLGLSGSGTLSAMFVGTAQGQCSTTYRDQYFNTGTSCGTPSASSICGPTSAAMMRQTMTCGQCVPSPGVIRGYYTAVVGLPAGSCAATTTDSSHGAYPYWLAETMKRVGTGKQFDDGCDPGSVVNHCTSSSSYSIASLKNDLSPNNGYVAVVSGDMSQVANHCCDCKGGVFLHTVFMRQYDPATDKFEVYDPDAVCNHNPQPHPSYWTSSEVNAFSTNNHQGISGLCVVLGKGVTSSTSSSDFLLDVTGYFTADASGYGFHALGTPVRMLDTRSGTSYNALFGKLSASAPVTFDGESACGAGAAAVTGNVTVTTQTAGWSIYLGPAPLASPPTSMLNFVVSDTRSNGVIVGLGSGNALSATYSGPAGNTTDLIFDETGAFY